MKDKITPPQDLLDDITSSLIEAGLASRPTAAFNAERVIYSEPFQAYLARHAPQGGEAKASTEPREPISVKCSIIVPSGRLAEVARAVAVAPVDAQVLAMGVGGVGVTWTEER